MASNPPPSYGTGAVYGITPEINEWIEGAIPDNAMVLQSGDVMRDAKQLMSKVAPTWTVKALENAFHKRYSDDWYLRTGITRGKGVISLPFALVGDVLKAPLYLFRAAVSAVWNTAKARKTERQGRKMILTSFYKRFEATLMILIKLNMETPDTLYNEFQKGKIDIYLTLTLFFTAFASRCAPEGCICLASGTILPRHRCPDIGLALFDKIHILKDRLILAGLSKKLSIQEAASIVELWLPRIVQELRGEETGDAPKVPQPLLEALSQIQNEIGKLPAHYSENQYSAFPVEIAQLNARGDIQLC